jgi:uncharacterized protein YecE (DUF72 family)
VNGTYCGTQKPETFRRWAAETPEGFVFTLKAPRFATSRCALAEGGESIARFLASGLAELGQKFGPINWQLPPTKTFNPADMAAILDLLPDRLDSLPLHHATEARHESYACDGFTTFLRDRGIAVFQTADSDYPVIDAETAAFAYLRIMGTREDESLGYSEVDLDRWATRLQDIARTRDVFLFMISRHKAATPPLPGRSLVGCVVNIYRCRE